MAPPLRIGISGWRYKPWRGTFFPKDLPQDRELAFASRSLNSIEINGSFYSLQRPTSYRRWRDATPDDFVFSVKAPRFITHIKRLGDVARPLANFFASGVLALDQKLGPILWQLPPSFVFREDRLETFFKLLPRTTSAAAALARRHDDKLKVRAWTHIDRDRPLQHALEVRHASFETPRFIELLREHQIALVVADTAGKWPFMEDVTADFVYVRLHGDSELYVSGYTPEALKEWSRKIRTWHRGQNPRGTKTIAAAARPRRDGRGVFVYFDNDVKVRAPFDAMSLAYQLRIGSKPQPSPDVATITETPRTLWPGFGRQNTKKQPAPRKPRRRAA